MSEDKSYLSLKGDTNYWLKHLQILNVGRVARLLSKKDKEIERLNEELKKKDYILTEFEKWLKEELHYHKGVYFAYNGCDDLCEALNKLEELKENK